MINYYIFVTNTHTMNRLKAIFVTFSAIFFTQLAFAQGSLNALSFDGTTKVVSPIVNHNIKTNDFTFEAWVKPSTATGVQAIIANGTASPAIYTRTGSQLNGGKIGIFWHGTWYNTAFNAVVGKWQHIAVVRSNGIITIYVNGTADVNTFADATRMSNAKITLGYSGTGNEFLNGSIDEVRVWSEARTLDQIRTNMCSRIESPGATLQSYWRFDESAGTTNKDHSNYSLNLTAVSESQRIVSGAPIGDTSAYRYNTSQTKSISVNSSQGSFDLQTIGTTAGVFVYRVDTLPNSIGNLQGIGPNRTYFGVFTVGATANTNGVSYNYNAFPEAAAERSTLKLYERATNEVTSWTVGNSTNDTVRNVFINLGSYETKEFFLAGFNNTITPPPTCLAPNKLIADNIKEFSARLNWTAGNSGNYELEYGLQGFIPGSGTRISVNQKPYLLNGLQSNTTYDVYLRSVCDSLSKSDSIMTSFTTKIDYSAVGAGNAGNFANTKGFCEVPALLLNANTLSMMAWVNPTAISSGTSGIVFCNDSSTQAGLVLKSGNEIAYRWNGDSAAAKFSSKLFVKAGQWTHIALIVSPDSAILCLNGNCVTNRISHTYEGFDGPTRFGSISKEQSDFEGQLDELTMWSNALTVNEVRNSMCQKMKSYPAELIGYWNFDHLPGSTQLIERSGNSLNANLFGLDSSRFFVESAAPIGDTSVYSYSLKNSLSIKNTNAKGDFFAVENIEGNTSGLHVYRIEGQMNYDQKLIKIPGNETYYGVFATEPDDMTYDVRYGYIDNFAASTDEFFTLYSRATPIAKIWSIQDKTLLDTGVNEILLQNNTSNKQYAAGLRIDTNGCNAPTALTLLNRNIFAAKIGWTTGGANHWNLEYGNKGFVLGQGTKLNYYDKDTISFGSLDGKSIYEIYVQDTCLGGGASVWNGPLEFSAVLCEAPENAITTRIDSNIVSITWDGNGFGRWRFEYGPAGFAIGTGNVIEVTELPLLLDKLDRFGNFDFYISTYCVDGSLSDVSRAYSFSIDKLPIACLAPETFTFTKSAGIPNQGELNWATGPFRKWTVEIGVQGFVKGTGNERIVTALPMILSGLSASVTYDAYVASFCDDSTLSVYAGPITFSLDSGIILNPNPPTNIRQHSNGGLQVFPNPVTDNSLVVKASLQQATKVKIQLVDVQGRTVLVEEHTNTADYKHKLDVSKLDKGLYIVKLSTDKEQYVQKVMIQ